MKSVNASVVIPSYRSDMSSMRRLILTIDLFLNQGFEVVVADNSGSQQKHEQLVTEFGDALVFAKTVAHCKAMDNFLAGFSAASRDYVLFASDDDTFLPTGIAVLAETISNSSGFIGFCASTVRYANYDTTIATVPDLSGETESERLIEWVNCDIAVSFYGCYHRHLVWQRYFNFIHRHPLNFAHHDQLLRFIVADTGSIVGLNSAWYAYDYSNWADSHIASASLTHYYSKLGFDERMLYVHSVLEGLEGALLQFTLDEVAGRTPRYEISAYWWSIWFDQFNLMIMTRNDSVPAEVQPHLQPLIAYLSKAETANLQYILALLSDYMISVYGTDGGLQAFWLTEAADSLRL